MTPHWKKFSILVVSLSGVESTHTLALLTKRRKPFKVTLAGGSGARNKCSETKAEYNENH